MPSNPKNVRRCVVCRGHFDKSEMTRFTLKDGIAHVDGSPNGGGRGAYVCASPECRRKLAAKKLLNAAFKRDVGTDAYGELDND